MVTTTILDVGAVRPIHKGAWSSTATYDTLNIVSYDGSSWMMSASSYTVGTTPVDGDTWSLLAAKGSSLAEDASTATKGIAYLATDAEITAGTNTTKIVTPKHLSDKVSAEISSLVNSAPEALDTLNELAAALGDDANFATTVAANIGTVSTAASDAQTTADNAVSAAATAQSAADAVATTTTTGRVSVGTGLEVTAAGALSISSENQTTLSGAASLLTEVSVDAGALKVVRADSSGKISSGYLPISTTTSVGGVMASASFSVDQTTGEATVPAATTSIAGIARQATNDEASTGAEGSLFVTPFHLQTYGVPSGVIVMWSGATDAVPTGWALCDGENSTPDLRDRFVVGAGSTYDVGDTGGSATVSGTVGATTLTVAQMPGHAHSARYASSSASSGTRVDCLLRTTPTTADGTTTVLNNTGSSQSHTHSFSGTAFANLPPYYALAYIMKL